MQKAHGLGLAIGGVYQGGLSNSGEELVLADSNTNNLVKLYYEDRAPWPEAADGQGPSLVFHGSIAGFNDPRTWRLGQMEGTPGTGEGKRYLANPSLDSDGNGQSDLLDYALGQDANGQTNFPVFKIDPSNGEVTADLRGTYTVWQNLAAEDLSFSLEYSLDLRNWQPITNQLDVGETKFLDTGLLERNWHKRISSDTDPVNFFRLRIEDH